MVLAEVPAGKCCSWVTRVDLFCWAMSNLEMETHNDADNGLYYSLAVNMVKL